MILLMGGTQDAREVVKALNLAFPRTMIVATAVSDYGADLLRKQGGCVVLQGAMDAAALTQLYPGKGSTGIGGCHPPLCRGSLKRSAAGCQRGGHSIPAL
ncbi:precorrin-6A/cobalt-precorrin-6A reductase [Dethiobacter alkaliphilus]|uniref:precorrin-6A/cobalt-precorrin-6A reductase n=1 Tax=Dethiobacter alkaliphilus TaxID=427926 RepID=UPI00117D14B9|nr:precorrin-6A/cobalt-precorrin-6A reductase [Dethiobacter alkaliphilus]